MDDKKIQKFRHRLLEEYQKLIRSINRFRKKEPAPAAPTTKECPQCFTTIPIQATRCPNCTSQI